MKNYLSEQVTIELVFYNFFHMKKQEVIQSFIHKHFRKCFTNGSIQEFIIKNKNLCEIINLHQVIKLCYFIKITHNFQ